MIQSSFFLLILLMVAIMGVHRVFAVDCHNCISRENDDMGSCTPLTVDQLRVQLKNIEGPQFDVILDEPEACVKIRMSAISRSGQQEEGETVIRTQIKMDRLTTSSIFGSYAKSIHQQCQEMPASGFTNRRGSEVNVLACICISDHCNHQGRASPQTFLVLLGFPVLLFLLSHIKF